MNKNYRVIWNKSTQTWQAVAEFAKAQGKSGGVIKTGVSSGIYTAVRFAYTIIMSGVLIATGQVAFGATGAEASGKLPIVPSAQANACYFDTASETVICGDAKTNTVDSVPSTSGQNSSSKPKSVVLGIGANNKGESTVAIGNGASTEKVGSIAIGANSKATADQAVALGLGAHAVGNFDVAVGRNAMNGATTKGSASNIAIGDGALALAVKSDNNSAIGTSAGNKLTGEHNVMFGAYANSVTALEDLKDPDIAAGSGVTANNTVAVGGRALATKNSAVSVGNRTQATGLNSTALGTNAKASNMAGVAVGHMAAASGSHAIAIGGVQNAGNEPKATNSYSIAVGTLANSTGQRSVAMGYGANAKANDTLAFGSDANANADSAIAIGRHANHQPQVTENGVTTPAAAKTVGVNSITIGYTANAEGQSSNVIGNSAYAKGKDSTAMGTGTKALAQSAVAIGTNATANNENSFALGNQATTSGNNAVSLGTSTKAEAQSAIAVGDGSTAKQTRAIAIGTGTAETKESIALGASALANGGNNATAIGRNAQSKNEGALAVGTNTVASGWLSTSIGYEANSSAQKSVAVGHKASTTQDHAVALGDSASATIANGVALGSNSVANTDKGKVGADPLSATTDKANSTWTSTHAAVSVGNGTAVTRQITSVAAGTKDTDAVNVAQLKAAGFVVNTTNSDGELGTKTVGTTKDDDNKVQNGETFTIDAGKNIKVTQNGAKVSIATKDEVEFTSVTAGTGDNQVILNNDGVNVGGNTYINNDGLNANSKKITNVADGIIGAGSKDAINGGQLQSTIDTLNTSITAAKTHLTAGDNTVLSGTGTAADPFKVNVATTNATVTRGNVTVADADKNKFLTAGDVAAAINGSEKTSSVVQGAGVTITPKAEDANGNTEYTVALDQATQDSLAKADTAVQSIKVKANGKDVTTLDQTNDTLDITQGDNITVSNDGGKVKVALNKDLTGLDSVTTNTLTAGTGDNQVVLGNDGVKIGGKTYITSAGLNANNQKVTNVANGAISADSKDAINGSQLHGVSTSVKNILGGNAKVADNGSVSMTDIGGTGENNIHDAIQAINTKAAQAKTEVTSTNKTVGIKETANGNGATVYDLSINTGTGLTVADDGKINVNTDNTTITTDSTTGAIKANTTALTINKNGTVATPTNTNALATAGDIANAINNAGFTLKTSANGGSKLSGNDELITTGDSLEMVAGKNLTVKQDANGKVTYATADDVSFNKTTSNNVVINNNGSLSVGKNAKVDMGANVIGNVASGLNGRTLDDIKADLEAGKTVAEVSNVATIGDLATVQNSVTNITNILGESATTATSSTVATGDKLGTGSNASVALIDATNVLKDKDGKPILTTYNVSGQTEYIQNDVVQAINHMNEQGIRFFHVNDGTVEAEAQAQNSIDSSASGAYATAIGYQTLASADNAVAMGNTHITGTKTQGAQVTEITDANGVTTYAQATKATGKNAVAIGTGSQALNENTIAIGTGNIVTGKNSGAIGDPTVVTGDSAYSVGNNNTVSADNAYALGSNIKATQANSVFLGDESSSNGVHTTADGGNYTFAGANDQNVAGGSADKSGKAPVGVVSVGTEGGQTRQIQNVSAGVVSADSTDAINGSQLYYTNEAIGNLANNTINMGNQLNARIDEVKDEANAGVSSAMAMASLPQAYIPGKSMLTGGVASYNGEGAVAVGLSKLSDNGRWVLKISGSADTKGNAGGAVGAGFHF